MTITIYSKPACVQCNSTYRAFDSKGLAYVVVDLTEVPAALEYVMNELGYSQAPVVVVDDENHWSGFRPDLINWGVTISVDSRYQEDDSTT